MFKKIKEHVVFRSPLKDFEPDSQDIEYRMDPLTGKWSRVNIQRSKRVRQAEGGFDLEELIERSKKNCFFCPEHIERSTPRFTEQLIPGGYIQRGETRVFPNLFPFARHHAVATLTTEHFLRTGEFKESQIRDTLLASLQLCKILSNKDPGAMYATFNWNHLFPSGASIIHPHVQVTLDSRPTYMSERLMSASKKYQKNTGKNYWRVLLDEEIRLGERFIRSVDDIHVLSSYSPFGNNEILILFEGLSAFTEIEDERADLLAKVLMGVLKGYSGMGVESFNLTTYSGPVQGDSEGFWLQMRLVSRSQPRPYYTSDIGFMEGLHFERVVEALPEDVARTISAHI